MANFYFSVLLNQKNKGKLVAEKFKNGIEKAIQSNVDFLTQDICNNTGFMTVSVEKGDMLKICALSDSVTNILGSNADLTKNYNLESFFPKHLGYYYKNLIDNMLEVQFRENPYYDFHLCLVDTSGFLHIWSTRAIYSINFMRGFNLMLQFTGLNTLSMVDANNFSKTFEKTLIFDEAFVADKNMYLCFNQSLNLVYIDSDLAKLFDINMLELSTMNVQSLIGGMPQIEALEKNSTANVELLFPAVKMKEIDDARGDDMTGFRLDNTLAHKMKIVEDVMSPNGRLLFGVISRVKTHRTNHTLTKKELQSTVTVDNTYKKSKSMNKTGEIHSKYFARLSTIMKIAKIALFCLLTVKTIAAAILLLFTYSWVFKEDYVFINKQLHCKPTYEYIYRIHLDYQQAYLSGLIDPNTDLSEYTSRIKNNIYIYENSLFNCFSSQQLNLKNPDTGYLIGETPSHREMINMFNNFDFVEPKMKSIKSNFLKQASYVFDNIDISDLMFRKSIAPSAIQPMKSDKMLGILVYCYFPLLLVYLVFFLIHVQIQSQVKRTVLTSFTNIDTIKFLEFGPIYQNFISNCLSVESGKRLKDEKSSRLEFHYHKEKALQSLANYNQNMPNKSNSGFSSKPQPLINKQPSGEPQILVKFAVSEHIRFLCFIATLIGLFTVYYIVIVTLMTKYCTSTTKLTMFGDYLIAQKNNAINLIVLYGYASHSEIQVANFMLFNKDYIDKLYERIIEQDSTLQKIYKEDFMKDSHVFGYFQRVMNGDICNFIDRETTDLTTYQEMCNYGGNTVMKNYLIKLYEFRVQNKNFETDPADLFLLMERSKLVTYMLDLFIDMLFEYFKKCASVVRGLQITFMVVTVFLLLFFNLTFLLYAMKKLKREEKVGRHFIIVNEKYWSSA